MFLEFRKRKAELTENGSFCLFAVNVERKRKTSVCLLQMERETEVCFPCSANDKRQSTIAVSANVHICANLIF
jgi:hypothetical protein